MAEIKQPIIEVSFQLISTPMEIDKGKFVLVIRCTNEKANYWNIERRELRDMVVAMFMVDDLEYIIEDEERVSLSVYKHR